MDEQEDSRGDTHVSNCLFFPSLFTQATEATEGLEYLAGSPPGDVFRRHILDSIHASNELVKKNKEKEEQWKPMAP